MTPFDDLGDLEPQQLFTGLLARTVHGERITMAVVELDPGAELPEHRHENEQLGMVLGGSLEFRVGDESRELRPGQTWRIPPNVPHEVTAGAEGAVVIDVFAPPRTDWTGIERAGPRSPRWP